MEPVEGRAVSPSVKSDYASFYKIHQKMYFRDVSISN